MNTRELDLLLAQYTGAAKYFSRENYIKYMGDYNAYKLPWETETELARIFEGVKREVASLSAELKVAETVLDRKNSIADNIDLLREERKKYNAGKRTV